VGIPSWLLECPGARNSLLSVVACRSVPTIIRSRILFNDNCNYFYYAAGYLLSVREKAILDWGHSIPDGSSQPLWIADSIPHVFIVVYRHLGVRIYSMNSNFDNGR
jgi:hypothetical protein